MPYQYNIDHMPSMQLSISKEGVVKMILTEDFTIVLPRFVDNPYTEAQVREDVSCTIHKGTSTNYASIPWYIRWLISPIDPVLALTSVVHDALVNEFGDSKYSLKFVNSVDGEAYNGEVSWKMAADSMLSIMNVKKGTLDYFKSRAIYSAIRLHGYIKGFDR